MSDKVGQEIQKVPGSTEISSENSIKMTNSEVLDLTGLSEGQVSELKQQYVSGMIDIKKKAEELKVDVGALDAAMHSFTDQTSKATQAGASATISHTQTSSLGRTEIMIGNTDKAASGKISRSGRGEQDRTIWIVGIIAVAAVVIAVIAMGGK